jgi:hypothetical protein
MEVMTDTGGLVYIIQLLGKNLQAERSGQRSSTVSHSARKKSSRLSSKRHATTTLVLFTQR